MKETARGDLAKRSGYSAVKPTCFPSSFALDPHPYISYGKSRKIFKQVKTSKNMKRGKNFYLYRIYQLIQQGKSQEEIAKELKFSKQNLYYYRKQLSTLGFIKYSSYGIWEIAKEWNEEELEKGKKEVKKTTRIGVRQLEEVKNKQEIRGHAFQIKLKLPEKYKNWEKREKVFEHIGLNYDPLEVGGIKRGQQAEINGKRVHFYNKSIVISLDEDYLFKTAKEAKSYALVDFLKVIKRLERMFNNSPLSLFGKYKIKVTRQHYAIIRNALARQYLNEEKKLHVYTSKGLWLLIDNSFKLEELETVHKDSADEDNEKVQDVFNNIKKENRETLNEMTHGNVKAALSESAKQIKQNAENQAYHAENLRSHVESIQKLGAGVEKLTSIIEELKGGLK